MFSLALACCLLVLVCAHASAAECERLPKQEVYTQATAPRDINSMLRTVTGKLNEEISGVMGVDVEYDGPSLHSVVGKHDVLARVTRQTESKDLVESCFIITFLIQDVNECVAKDSWRHRCHPTSVCVNTEGSYECVCPAGKVANPSIRKGLCRGLTSTASCCGQGFAPGGNLLQQCKESFECVNSICPGDCAPNANCVDLEGFYECSCPSGLLGNGTRCLQPPPQVWVSPNGSVLDPFMVSGGLCGCQLPRVDYCVGVRCDNHSSCRSFADRYECTCDPGFTYHKDYGCVDKTPPTLNIKGGNPLVLSQCSMYEEFGVETNDQNAEDYSRRLKIIYSRPLGSCLYSLQPFVVNYTLTTPWTEPAVTSKTRQVVIRDVNECNWKRDTPNLICPECTPRCVPEAQCVNTQGSYSCQCPTCSEGDGFMPSQFRPGTAPPSYLGGSGCRDTCAPVITLLGSNPLVLYVYASAGLKCVGPGVTPHSKPGDYEEDLTTLIRESDGGVLCDAKNTGLLRCAEAVDRTPTSTVNLTSQVKVGLPAKVPGKLNIWKIPYDVEDAAGNKAATVFREVQIKVLSFDDIQLLVKKSESSCDRSCPNPVSCKSCCNPCPECEKCSAPVSKCPPCPKCDKTCPDTNTNPNLNRNPRDSFTSPPSRSEVILPYRAQQSKQSEEPQNSNLEILSSLFIMLIVFGLIAVGLILLAKIFDCLKAGLGLDHDVDVPQYQNDVDDNSGRFVHSPAVRSSPLNTPGAMRRSSMYTNSLTPDARTNTNAHTARAYRTLG